MDKLFKLSLRGTDKKTEIIAGLTTFMTMAYVLAVQPAAICGGEAYITDVNGVVITKSAIMITCALVSGLITLLMAFYTNFPFALSTGMGSNFILGALIQSQALSFGAAMVITLISGIVFVLLTVFGLRDLIVRVIPKNIKIAISASIGFFIAYLGFKNCGIGTIGDIARCTPEYLHTLLGKLGYMFYVFANGLDNAKVSPTDFVPPIKSVGHGTTCVVDLDNEYAVWLVLYELAQDVGHRLRESELAARGVQLTVKDKDFGWQQFQLPLSFPTQSPLEMAQAAFALFRARYNWLKPVRALTVRGINLVPEKRPVQLDMFDDVEKRERRKALDDAIDEIRRRFGYRAICPASLLGDLRMAQDKCETVTMPGLMYM